MGPRSVLIVISALVITAPLAATAGVHAAETTPPLAQTQDHGPSPWSLAPRPLMAAWPALWGPAYASGLEETELRHVVSLSESDFAGGIEATPDDGFVVANRMSSGAREYTTSVVLKFDEDGDEEFRLAIPKFRVGLNDGLGVDDDGNIVLFGVTPGGATPAPENRRVIKLDPQGHTLWDKEHDVPEGLKGIQGALGSQGGIYLWGTVPRGEIGFDGDPWVARLSPDGDMLWNRTVSSPWQSGQAFTVLNVAPDGTIYLAGTALTGGDRHILLQELGPQGDPLNHAVFEADYAVPQVIRLGPDGEIYIAGAETHHFGWLVGGSVYRGFIMKVTSDLEQVWHERIGIGDKQTSINGMDIDANGDLVAGGCTRAKNAGNNPPAEVLATRSDAWVARVHPDGTTAFTRVIEHDPAGQECAYDVALSTSGEDILTTGAWAPAGAQLQQSVFITKSSVESAFAPLTGPPVTEWNRAVSAFFEVQPLPD